MKRPLLRCSACHEHVYYRHWLQHMQAGHTFRLITTTAKHAARTRAGGAPAAARSANAPSQRRSSRWMRAGPGPSSASQRASNRRTSTPSTRSQKRSSANQARGITRTCRPRVPLWGAPELLVICPGEYASLTGCQLMQT